VNYQQNDWTNWLATVEFQYNDKKHTAMGRTPFKLNFGRHPWKGDLMVQTGILRVEEFLIGLQKSWEQATKAILIKPYKVSTTISLSSQISFIIDEVENLFKYMKFV